MVKWETLVVAPNKVPASHYEIDVRNEVRDALVQHLNCAVPEFKAGINKNGFIVIYAVYTQNTLWNVLGEVGWELLPPAGAVAIFKRQRQEEAGDRIP